MHPRLMVLLLAMPVAFAQSAPGVSDKKIRLEGRAVSTTGESVRKATIRLMGSGSPNGQQPSIYSETTDNEGKFLFDDVAPGRYTLMSEKTGFVNGRYGARSPNSPGIQLSVSAGQEMKDLVFVMTPQGVITGRVTDQDGDPVRGVQVTVLRAGYSRGRRQYMPMGGAGTDDQGNFRAGNLAPGRYLLSATDRSSSFGIGVNERPGRASPTPRESNVTTYYPQALDVASASAIDVSAGAELAGFNIRLRRERTYSIRGKAVDPSGAPPQNAILRATPKLDDALNTMLAMMSGLGQQARPPDGAFEFRNLAPGTYLIRTMPGFNNNGTPVAPLTGRMEVTITDANVEGVVFPLSPGMEITGTVRVEGGDVQSVLSSPGAGQGIAGVMVANAAGAPVSAIPATPRLIVSLVENTGISSVPSAQVKEDGTFKVQAAGPGKYFLNVGGLPEGSYLKSIRLGNQDVTHDTLDLTSGGGGVIEILLSPKAADVSGVLQDDKGAPIAGVQVTVWPKTPVRGRSGSGVRAASTDQNGSFKVSSLVPGEYFVAAWEDAEPGLTMSEDFAAKFSSDAAAVKLGESAHETVTLKLISSDRIAAEAAKLP